MPINFFEGQVKLLLKRARLLEARLGALSHLSAELVNYRRDAESQINKIIKRIEDFLADPDFGAQPLLINQFDKYKRFAEALNIYEWHTVALLDRYNEKDLYFYRFAELFCRQIGYPYQTPLINAHSSDYFSSLPYLHIINVPLCGDRHFLAQPDFAHELGHIIYIRARAALLRAILPELGLYIGQQKTLANRNALANSYQDKFNLLEQVWEQRYVVEFFCDACAVYLVGAAYGWSHLRLVLATQSNNIYRPSFGEVERHPADESRMRLILLTLKKLGADAEAHLIEIKWNDFVALFIDQPDNEYDFCYPDDLLEKLAGEAISVCQNLKLVPFYDQPETSDNLPFLMREAWEQYNADQNGYTAWEEQKADELVLLLKR